MKATNINLSENTCEDYYGNIYLESSSFSIENALFKENKAYKGGAMYLYLKHATELANSCKNCTFAKN